jgi:hypothetical protein
LILDALIFERAITEENALVHEILPDHIKLKWSNVGLAEAATHEIL